MALSEEAKAKLKESLDSMSEEEIKDLAIALSDKLDDEKIEARTERQKALAAFFHPEIITPTPIDVTEGETMDVFSSPSFTSLQKRVLMR